VTEETRTLKQREQGTRGENHRGKENRDIKEYERGCDSLLPIREHLKGSKRKEEEHGLREAASHLAEVIG
jgi:hypothetical protein